MFMSDIATTFERVEDLTCDPVTHASWRGVEAILAKDAFNELYEAFEVEDRDMRDVRQTKYGRTIGQPERCWIHPSGRSGRAGLVILAVLLTLFLHVQSNPEARYRSRRPCHRHLVAAGVLPGVLH